MVENHPVQGFLQVVVRSATTSAAKEVKKCPVKWGGTSGVILARRSESSCISGGCIICSLRLRRRSLLLRRVGPLPQSLQSVRVLCLADLWLDGCVHICSFRERGVAYCLSSSVMVGPCPKAPKWVCPPASCLPACVVVVELEPLM